MKNITIYSVGSCSNQTREGSATVLMECNGSRVVSTFSYQSTTAKRCVIQGLIDGVSGLQESFHVVLVTSTPLALDKARKGEGPNRDLIDLLHQVLAAKGCSYAFDFWEGRGKELTRLISN